MTGVPSGWSGGDRYWSATPSASGHASIRLSTGYFRDEFDGYNYCVAFEVL